MVIKYAQTEGKIIVTNNKARATEDKMKEVVRDKQHAIARMKQIHADRERTHAEKEKKVITNIFNTDDVSVYYFC